MYEHIHGLSISGKCFPSATNLKFFQMIRTEYLLYMGKMVQEKPQYQKRFLHINAAILQARFVPRCYQQMARLSK